MKKATMTVYIANDGEIFDSEIKCISYEKSKIKDLKKAKLNMLPHEACSAIECYYCADDNDRNILAQYCRNCTDGSGWILVEKNDIHLGWNVVVFYDNNVDWVWSLDAYKKAIIKIAEQIDVIEKEGKCD